MACTADYRTRRVSSGGARVESFYGSLVREAIRKPEAVINVVNVAASDAKVLLELRPGLEGVRYVKSKSSTVCMHVLPLGG